ncbi:MAG: fasciclin domain-containing protein [Culturomica sp.]|jgi:hypothetical protein|nr:fasciclin domain-containing protein [Culturomica sp.]
MKKIVYLLITAGLFSLAACQEDEAGKMFEPPGTDKSAQFLIQEEYPEWYGLLEATGMEAAFNLGSTPLTCFVTNDSVLLKYVESRGYNDIPSWVAAEPDFAQFFVRYHTVLNQAYELSMFRNGKMQDSTASGDFLTCRFVAGTEGGIYMNNASRILGSAQEALNGFVHELDRVIDPVTQTLYGYVEQPGYSLFKQAIDATGTRNYFDQMTVEQLELRCRRTLFLTPDEVYREKGITSLDDLKALVSPGQTNYTDPENPLNLYVLFHLLEGDYSTTELAEMYDIVNRRQPGFYVSTATGYTLGTYAENKLLLIQALGADYIFNGQVKFRGDKNNQPVRNGFVHEIDGMLEIVEHENILTTIETTEWFGFTKISEYRNQSIERFKQYLVAEELTPWFTWKTTPVNKPNAVAYSAFTTGAYSHYTYNWGRVMAYGDFIVADVGAAGEVTLLTRPIPKGTYKVNVMAQTIKQVGGIFQLYIDGRKVGGNISMYDPEWDSVPAREVTSEIIFEETRRHTITMKAVKSGIMTWDSIVFTPVI